MFSKTPVENAVRDAKRIAQQQANRGRTRAQSERGSAAWHRLNDTERAMKKGGRR